MASGKQRRTFISYSRVNKEFAIRLARELRSDGYLIWFDQFDIPTGSRWDDQVEKALEDCEIFLLILTPAAIASENVKDEIGYAIDNRKHILPLLLENCNVPLRLRRFQYVDFTTKNFDDGIESAKQLLTNLINEDTLPRIEVPATLQVEDAQPKAEAERLAKEKAAREAKAETDRVAAQKMEAERLAQQKAEREAKTKAQPAPLIPIETKVGKLATETNQKIPMSRGLMIGIMAVVGLVVIAGIGINALSKRAATAATETPVITEPATEVVIIEHTSTSTTAATNEPATATSTPVPSTQAILSKFLKINFAQNTGMDVFDIAEIGLGENKVIDRTLSDKGLALTLNGSDLYLYYFYEPFIYQDIAVKVRVENLGTINRNNVSLICRKTNSTWYEFSVASDGLWFLFDYNEGKAKRYTMIGNGGSTAIKTGQNANEYEMKCVGNEISLFINGQKAKTIKNDLYAEGQVGFNISSLDLFPVEINVSEFEISKP